MSRRNVWLKFDEWELICKELSDQNYHDFKLGTHSLKEWNEDRKNRREVWNLPEQPKCFDRVGIYPTIEYVKSARAFNILCRENWRPQDMYDMMKYLQAFVGFIITHCDDVNMNTTQEEWEQIRNSMKDTIDNSGKNTWWEDDLIDLYHQTK